VLLEVTEGREAGIVLLVILSLGTTKVQGDTETLPAAPKNHTPKISSRVHSRSHVHSRSRVHSSRPVVLPRESGASGAREDTITTYVRTLTAQKFSLGNVSP
jgi:hypothetical protein